MTHHARHTIVCLSSQSWDDAMWTNKQHIMSRLAHDHRVIHVDYGLKPLPLYVWKRLKHRPADLAHPFRMLVDGVQRRPEMPGELYVADSYNPIWAGLFGHGHPVRDFASFDLKTLFLKRFLEREGIDDPIVWVYHPGYAAAVDRLPKKLLVYDCVDNYPAFPTYADHSDWIAARERTLCRKADLVLTTSQELYDLKAPYNPEHTHLVHNVGDYAHFSAAQNPALGVPEELAALDGPIIGFVGAVSDYKLNTDWLLHAARRHPEWNIVVVGPVGLADPSTDVQALQQTPNVHLLGHRDYAVLPRYLKGFDVATIPYRINQATRSVFPIKFFEYLATGTPVVISNLPALESFYDAVQVAKTAEAFVACCEAALAAAEQGDPDRQARIELAKENAWPKRIGTIMDLIEDRLAW